MDEHKYSRAISHLSGGFIEWMALGAFVVVLILFTLEWPLGLIATPVMVVFMGVMLSLIGGVFICSRYVKHREISSRMRRFGVSFSAVVLGSMLVCLSLMGQQVYLQQYVDKDPRFFEDAPVLITEDASGSGAQVRVRGLILERGLTPIPVRLEISGDERYLANEIYTLRGVYPSRSGISFDAAEGRISGLKAQLDVASYPWYLSYLGLITYVRHDAIQMLEASLTAQDSGEVESGPSAEGDLPGAENLTSLRALIKALLVGERSELFDSELYQQVKEIGLAHMVAVSGTHVSIALALFLSLARMLKLSRRVRVGTSIGFVVLYVCFTGASLSSIRSAIMVVIALCAFLYFRRASPLRALSIVVLIFVLTAPASVGRVSMVLSVLSTFGILSLSDAMGTWVDVILRGHVRFLRDIISVSLAAIITTLPYQIMKFGWVSFAALISNILITPLCSLFMSFGLIVLTLMLIAIFLGLSVVIGPLGGFLYLTAQPLVLGILLIAGLPFTGIRLGYPEIASGVLWVLLIGFFILRPRPSFKRLALGVSALSVVLVFIIIVSPALSGTQFIMLDIGQGDACVMREGAHALLIDTGTDDEKLLRGLAKHHISELDAVLLTHADDDHVGSLAALLREKNVGRIYVARDALQSSEESYQKLRDVISGEEVVGLRTGDHIEIGPITGEIISPQVFENDGDNADSLVCLLRVQRDEAVMSILCTGDAESPVLEPLASQIGQVDILKVAHHGSAISLSDSLLDQIHPRFALISAGVHNRFGHPRPETISYLDNHAIPYALTAENGDIVCTFNPEGFQVRVERYNTSHG